MTTGMSLDNALNFTWALLAVATLASFIAAEWRRKRATLAPRFRRGVALLVILIALFPTVSATDDVVQMQSLRFGIPAPQQLRRQSAAGPTDSSALYLARLSETFQTIRVSSPFSMAAAWFFTSLSALPTSRSHTCCLSSPATRAPPCCVSLS